MFIPFCILNEAGENIVMGYTEGIWEYEKRER